MDKELLKKIKNKISGEKNDKLFDLDKEMTKSAIAKMGELVSEMIAVNIKNCNEEEFIMFKDGKFQNFPIKKYLIQNKGDKGDKGLQGEATEFEWDGTKIRFKDNFGMWGEFVELLGETGKTGINGERGERGVRGLTGFTGEQGKSVNEKALEDRLLIQLLERMEGKIDEEMPEKEKKILDKLQQKLIEMVQRMQVHGGGIGRKEVLALISGATGNITRDDLSAQCDGANLVFTLTNNFTSGSVALWSTQFPIVYRPGVDYTETGANEITLVAGEVGAPQVGQTLMALYER